MGEGVNLIVSDQICRQRLNLQCLLLLSDDLDLERDLEGDRDFDECGEDLLIKCHLFSFFHVGTIYVMS